MDPVHLETGAIAAVMVSEALQFLKNCSWFTLLTSDTANLNRIVSGLAAFVAGLGITYSFDPHTGTAVISGLNAAAMGHGIAQWVQQQLYYRLVLSKAVK